MCAVFAWACALVLWTTLVVADSELVDGGKLIAVHSITRHGSRAPDDTHATRACLAAVLKTKSVKKVDFVNVFGAVPGSLTLEGVAQCKRVGAFLRNLYMVKTNFVGNDYSAFSSDFAFVSREGSRQQRSAMAVALGMFPLDSVPIKVVARELDTVLSGPPLDCATTTYNFIAAWHERYGAAMLNASTARREVVASVEKACNLSGLMSDPLETAKFSPNPHAQLTDVSDFMDGLPERQFSPMTAKQGDALSRLSFILEQSAHFPVSDPAGALMFAGDFPKFLFASWDEALKFSNPSLLAKKRTKKSSIAKLTVLTCSRDLMYALDYLFELSEAQIPGEPSGRLNPGSTFIFELYSNAHVRVLFFYDSLTEPVEVLNITSVDELKNRVAKYQNITGATWRQICKVDSHSRDGGDVWVNEVPPIPWSAFTASLLVSFIVFRWCSRPGGNAARPYQPL